LLSDLSQRKDLVMAAVGSDSAPESVATALEPVDREWVAKTVKALGAAPWRTKFSTIEPTKVRETGHNLWTLRIHLDRAVRASDEEAQVFFDSFRCIYGVQRRKNLSFALRFEILEEGITMRAGLKILSDPHTRARMQTMQALARSMWPQTLHCVGCTTIQFPKAIGGLQIVDQLIRFFQRFFQRRINPPRFVTSAVEAVATIVDKLKKWPQEVQPYGTVTAEDGTRMTAERIEEEKPRIEAEHTKAMLESKPDERPVTDQMAVAEIAADKSTVH